MPVLGRLTPCLGCPWRRDSLRGYLGADEPVHFYWQSVTAEGEMPCHEQVDYEDPGWQESQLPRADFCAGNLIHYKNTMKVPRRETVAAAVQAVRKSAQVFTWAHEFLAHHMPGASREQVAVAARRATWATGPDQQ